MRSWDIDFSTERRLGQRNRYANLETIADAAKMWMRADVDREQNIASRRVASAGNTLSAQADFFAVLDPGRNFDFDRFNIAILPLDR